MSRKIGVVLSYILMIFEVLSTLLLTPFIIRTLGQAEYGVYKLVVAINAYLLLLDLGVGNAIIRYVAKYKIEKDEIKERQFLAVILVFYFIVAIAAIGIGCVLVAIFPTVFSKGLSDKEILLGQVLLSITMLNSAVTLGTAAYNNILIAYEKFAVSRVASIIQIIIRMILTYIVLILGWGSIGIVIVNLLMTILCRGYFIIYVNWIIKLKPLFKGIRLTFIKDIVIYSSFVLLQMIATQINSSVDQIMIGSLVKDSAIILGVYGVGTQIVQYFQSIGSAFTGVLMPGVVKLVENGAKSEELMNEMIRIGRIIFMVLSLIWCGFVVNGKEFVALWAGKTNIQAYAVAVILMFAYIFILTESIGSQILWAMNRHKEQAILKVVIVLLNIVFTAMLIKWDPLIGATIGTFVSLVLGDIVVMNLIFKKKIGINLKYYYSEIFKGISPCLLLTSIVGGFFAKLLPVGWAWLCLKIVIMMLAYGGTLLIFGMSEYEKGLYKAIINKLNFMGGK